MMEKSLDFLKTHYMRGLFCGPSEDFKSFYQRSSSQKISQKFPFYELKIDWAPIIYSDEKLNWWEGACTWTDACQAVLQLRSSFEKKEKLWGIYPKKELLEHEMVHACRLKFEEPLFEEILAYRTSKSSFRKFFGPLFRSQWETRIFIFFSLGSLIPILQLALFPLLLGFMSFSVLRLIRLQRVFTKVQKKLQMFIKGSIFLFMLSLSDQEFFYFSRSSIKEIQSYIDEQQSARWLQLKAVYF